MLANQSLVQAQTYVADPDFTHPKFRISDLGSRIQKPQPKSRVSCHTFFWRHKFHKIDNYFIFVMLKKKFGLIFQRIIELFTRKFVTKLSKAWVWDPGVKKAPDPGSGSATLHKTCGSENIRENKTLLVPYLPSLAKLSFSSSVSVSGSLFSIPSFANLTNNHRLNMEVDLQSLFGLHVT
jgi:hypothetical protein